MADTPWNPDNTERQSAPRPSQPDASSEFVPPSDVTGPLPYDEPTPPPADAPAKPAVASPGRQQAQQPGYGPAGSGHPPPSPVPPPWSMPPPPGAGWSPRPSNRWVLPVVVGACALVVLVGCLGVFLVFSPSRHATHSAGPSPQPSATAGGGRLSQSEYGNWRFRLGNVALNADKTGGQDFSSCGPMEQHQSLTSQGCQYGIEVDYSADHDQIRIVNMIMAFDSKAHATQAGKSLVQKDFVIDQKALYAQDATKLARWTRDTANEYLVITVCATASSADVKQVDTYLHYSNADETSALLWRD